MMSETKHLVLLAARGEGFGERGAKRKRSAENFGIIRDGYHTQHTEKEK